MNCRQLLPDKHKKINGVESFGEQEKSHLCKFNDVPQGRNRILFEGMLRTIK